jgi:hypothetical protein
VETTSILAIEETGFHQPHETHFLQVTPLGQLFEVELTVSDLKAKRGALIPFLWDNYGFTGHFMNKSVEFG